MISEDHVFYLREKVAQAEQNLAGWRQILVQAERTMGSGVPVPDPLRDPLPGSPSLFSPASRVSETGAMLRSGPPPYSPLMPAVDTTREGCVDHLPVASSSCAECARAQNGGRP